MTLAKNARGRIFASTNDEALKLEAATYIRQRGRQFIFDIGEALVEIKERLPHGEFNEWVSTELGYDRRTASNYMLAYNTFGNDDTALSGLDQITHTGLYELAKKNVSDETRQFILQVATNGTRLNKDTVKQLVYKHKEYQKNNIVIEQSTTSTNNSEENPVIDGEFTEVNDYDGNEHWPAWVQRHLWGLGGMNPMKSYLKEIQYIEGRCTVPPNDGVSPDQLAQVFATRWHELKNKYRWSDPLATLGNSNGRNLPVDVAFKETREFLGIGLSNSFKTCLLCKGKGYVPNLDHDAIAENVNESNGVQWGDNSKEF